MQDQYFRDKINTIKCRASEAKEIFHDQRQLSLELYSEKLVLRCDEYQSFVRENFRAREVRLRAFQNNVYKWGYFLASTGTLILGHETPELAWPIAGYFTYKAVKAQDRIEALFENQQHIRTPPRWDEYQSAHSKHKERIIETAQDTYELLREAPDSKMTRFAPRSLKKHLSDIICSVDASISR